jgi:D-serine deaminase-like pyridoxal phosphate-dependent protein
MNVADLPTPCLVLDRSILRRNIARMAERLAVLGVPLRPHMKTAKSIEVARLALAGQPGGITVSTLAEAEYFAAHGIIDILYAVGITPQKLVQVAKINAAGARVMVITDDAEAASAIATHPGAPTTLIEIDTGEMRGGVGPDDPMLLEIAGRLGPLLAGVMTHAGHSYAGRTPEDMALIAEAERAGVVRAAERLRAAGHEVPIVSMGSSPTALHAESVKGVTEIRAGVYMFGDLFQSEIGQRPGQVVIEAGGIALSKDRSTQATPSDYAYGLALDAAGKPTLGHSLVMRAYQEHGVVALDPAISIALPIGAKLRVAPNHTCMTVAAHDRYFVTDGGPEVVAVWPRVNGW